MIHKILVKQNTCKKRKEKEKKEKTRIYFGNTY